MELLKSKAHSLGFFLNVSIGELRRDTYLCKGLLRFSLSEMKTLRDQWHFMQLEAGIYFSRK